MLSTTFERKQKVLFKVRPQTEGWPGPCTKDLRLEQLQIWTRAKRTTVEFNEAEVTLRLPGDRILGEAGDHPGNAELLDRRVESRVWAAAWCHYNKKRPAEVQACERPLEGEGARTPDRTPSPGRMRCRKTPIPTLGSAPADSAPLLTCNLAVC